MNFWTRKPKKVNGYVLSKTFTHSSFGGPLAWMPPSNRFPQGGIVSGGMDVLLWDLQKGEVVETMTGHKSQVTGLAVDTNDDIISSSMDCTVIRWRDGNAIEVLEVHKVAVQAVLKLSTGELLTGSNDSTIKLWKGSTCLKTFSGHADTVTCLALMPDQRILSASHDSTIKLWALTGQQPPQDMIGHSSLVYSVDAHSSGLIASGSDDGSLKIWKDGVCVQSIEHPGCIWDAKFLGNGDIVTACSDGTTRIWTADSSRFCTDEEFTAYTDHISQYKLRRKTGGVELMDLPGVEALQDKGSSDGQTLIVREGRDAVAYSWNSAEFKWKVIKSFFCWNCLRLMRSGHEIIDHMKITEHKFFWSSLKNYHKLECYRCKDEFNSRTDVDTHWSGDHIVFSLNEEKPDLKELTDQTTPSPLYPSVTSSIMMDAEKRRANSPPNWSIHGRQLEYSDDSLDDDDSDDEVSALYSSPLNYASPSGESSHDYISSDDSAYDDSLTQCYPSLLESRTLKSLNFRAEKRKELRSKYVIAEGVPKEIALKRVNKELDRYEAEGCVYLRSKGNKGKKEGGTEAIVFDTELQQVCLKRLDKYKCPGLKAERIKKILEIIKHMLEDGTGERENSIHYMYHKELKEPGLKDEHLEKRINRAILTISETLRVSREALMIRPASKGVIAGPVQLLRGNKILCDCNYGGETGCLIPSEADLISEIKVTGSVKYVLVIEKETVFHHLAGKSFHEKENCILICGKGQPDVATRILLRKLKDNISLVHFYAMVDYNPSGVGIFWTYCFGSEERAHDNLMLTVSELELIGLCEDDINQDELIPFTDSDQTRLTNMLDRSLSLNHSVRDTLVRMDSLKKKADIEVLMKRKVLVDVIKKRIRTFAERNTTTEVGDVTMQLQVASLQGTV